MSTNRSIYGTLLKEQYVPFGARAVQMECKPADVFNVDCPSRDVLELVGSKWSMLVICTLKDGPVRTGELRRSVSGISQKMLTETLRDLERNGIIVRTDYRALPLRVEYSLTEVGHSLGRLMKQMEYWIIDHYDYIISAQKQHDTKVKSLAKSKSQTDNRRLISTLA